MKTVEELVLGALETMSDEFAGLKNANLETQIYGVNGNIDSLGLVGLLSDLEEIIESEFGVSVVIADERAMSSRNSPFKDAGSLVAFIETKIKEQK